MKNGVLNVVTYFISALGVEDVINVNIQQFTFKENLNGYGSVEIKQYAQ
jgi:hypothetical protein